MRKDVREVYNFAVANGFELVRFNGHYHMKHPDGHRLTFSATPADPHAKQNALADIRRALGLRREDCHKRKGKR